MLPPSVLNSHHTLRHATHIYTEKNTQLSDRIHNTLSEMHNRHALRKIHNTHRIHNIHSEIHTTLHKHRNTQHSHKHTHTHKGTPTCSVTHTAAYTDPANHPPTPHCVSLDREAVWTDEAMAYQVLGSSPE